MVSASTFRSRSRKSGAHRAIADGLLQRAQRQVTADAERPARRSTVPAAPDMHGRHEY
jgi:hypothetical protein